jgi:2-methylisocitrate lyase-like PEP mutase family enzyme
MKTQLEKAQAFYELHQQAGCFVAPNPWDAGSAKLMELLGFPALASTGAGFSFSTARPDFGVSWGVKMEHLTQLCAGTDLPISADLEYCGEGGLDSVQASLREAAETGIAGASIEDTTGNSAAPIRDIRQAAERVQAAVQAARSLNHPFVLTARADNHFYGINNLSDTIARLQAYQEAGADVLFAPGLKTREDISAVLSSVDKPINVLMGMPGCTLTVADLRELGVRRVSVGATLARVAYSAMLRAARQVLETGEFTAMHDAIPGPVLNKLFEQNRSLAERQKMLAERFV